MSSANAAAKKRRAPASQEPMPRPGQSQPAPNMNQVGLTLPQVIALVDNRLTRLEMFMSESKNEPESKVQTDVKFTDDFNSKFDTLAEEIANMKNIVLSLQSYTMDVNKLLMDERIRILSEIDESEEKSENPSFSFAP